MEGNVVAEHIIEELVWACDKSLALAGPYTRGLHLEQNG